MHGYALLSRCWTIIQFRQRHKIRGCYNGETVIGEIGQSWYICLEKHRNAYNLQSKRVNHTIDTCHNFENIKIIKCNNNFKPITTVTIIKVRILLKGGCIKSKHV